MIHVFRPAGSAVLAALLLSSCGAQENPTSSSTPQSTAAPVAKLTAGEAELQPIEAPEGLAAYPTTVQQPEAAKAQPSGAPEIPEHATLTWGLEPIVNTSPTQSEVILNGIWQFQPAVSPKVEPVRDDWGWIAVPGTWSKSWSVANVMAKGKGELWKKFGDGKSTTLAWYERPVWIPAEWRGRKISIELDRVSTEAAIYLNGKKCGEVKWPRGTVDVSEAVQFGAENELRVLVYVIADEKEVNTMMGTEEGHNEQVKFRLRSRGLTSDVILRAQAQSPEIEAMGIRTSVRKDELEVSFRAPDGEDPAKWQYRVMVLDQDGEVAKAFSNDKPPVQNEHGRWVLRGVWEDPKLWDIDQPNLYHLLLEIKNGDQMAVYGDRFGFREFWVDGRDFYLNGTKFRLRPHKFGSVYSPGEGNLIKAEIEGLQASGFNIKQIWPEPLWERGRYNFNKVIAEQTDEAGFGLMSVLPSVATLVDDWKEPGVQENWRRLVVDELARMGNHPSILIWGTSANRFGHGDDQNPLRIGRKDNPPQDPKWLAGATVANDAAQQINALDPTRPVLIHQGSATGDIYATNNYLCLLPLQEREEWLSDWAKNGNMPYIAIEFGVPLELTYMRGRNGGHRAGDSEPLMTEHAVSYLGPEAYLNETEGYRKQLKAKNSREKKSGGSWHGARYLYDESNYQDLTELFIRNTWRSWRTHGLSGGMIPWSDAGGIQNEWSGGYHSNWPNVPRPDFEPGKRGTFFLHPILPKNFVHKYQAEGNTLLPAWHTLLENNNETLAWIAGQPGAWPDKGHHFASGEELQKQVVLINDGRQPMSYSGAWTVSVAGKQVAEGELEGELSVSEISKLPIQAAMPEVNEKTEGEIILKAKVGDLEFEDRFPFRVYPTDSEEKTKAQAAKNVVLYDPLGKTGPYLKTLGIPFATMSGDWASLQTQQLLVIGEGALNKKDAWPDALASFAEKGGRVLLLAQPPDWWEDKTAFRVSKYVSRRFWPTTGSANHPLVDGFDGEDFRDWRGSGLNAPEKKYLELDKALRSTPVYGWHWGNRGSVSGGALEKPHWAGWTPLLEGEFDLGFTPLMELDLGKGKMVLCSLDLAQRTERDPVADAMMYRLISYLDAPVSQPKKSRAVAFTGSEAEAKWLQRMGLEIKPGQDRQAGDLWIIGRATGTEYDKLQSHADQGGKVLLLEAAKDSLPPGVSLKRQPYGAKPEVPEWEVMEGVSLGDLRTRFDLKLNLLEGEGMDLASSGLLGRTEGQDGGEIIYLQMHPLGLVDDKAPFLRFTNWRSNRLVAQLAANLGAGNTHNWGVFERPTDLYNPIPLAGPWKVKAEYLLDGAPDLENTNEDRGRESMTSDWQRPEFDDADWQIAHMPGHVEDLKEEYADKDGAFWFRRTVNIPKEWAGQDLVLSLDRLDDFDVTYWNGTKVGGISEKNPEAWSVDRVYRIPGWAVKEGENVIAIRIFDRFGGGGMMAHNPKRLNLSMASPPELPSAYVPGYRTDRENGDSPFRYFRW